MKTGFEEIDKTIDLDKSKIIVIGGKSDIAKTALALNIASNVAFQNKGVLIFSLEMSKEQLVNRLVASDALVENKKIRENNFNDEEWKKVVESVSKIKETKIFIDDTMNISIQEILEKIRKIKTKESINLIIIDELQLVTDNEVTYKINKKERILKILKELSKELNVPILITYSLESLDKITDSNVLLNEICKEDEETQYIDNKILLCKKKNSFDVKVLISDRKSNSINNFELSYLLEYCKYINK